MDLSEIEYIISGPAQAALMSRAATSSGDTTLCWFGSYTQQRKLLGVTDIHEKSKSTMVNRLILKCIVPLPPVSNLLKGGKANEDIVESWSKTHQPLMNMISTGKKDAPKEEDKHTNTPHSIVGLISFKRGLPNLTKPTIKDRVLCREFLGILKNEDVKNHNMNNVDNAKDVPFLYTLVKSSYGSNDLTSHRVSISHFRVKECRENIFPSETMTHSIMKFEQISLKISNLGDAPAPLYFQQTSSCRNDDLEKNNQLLGNLFDSENEMNVMGKAGKAQREYHRLLNDTMEERLEVEKEIEKLETEIREMKSCKIYELAELNAPRTTLENGTKISIISSKLLSLASMKDSTQDVEMSDEVKSEPADKIV